MGARREGTALGPRGPLAGTSDLIWLIVYTKIATSSTTYVLAASK